MKKKKIVTYNINNLPKSKTDLNRLRNMTEEEIYQAALSDPDAQPLTDEELAQCKKVVPGNDKAYSLDDFIEEQMKYPEFKKIYEEELVFMSIGEQIVKLRKEKKVSKKELANSLKLDLKTISRLECGEYKKCSLRMLVKIARFFDKKLEVNFK